MSTVNQDTPSGSKPSMAELKTTLNQQTSTISWEQLQRFYAAGSVIAVTPQVNLLEVACQFSLDNKERVAKWLNEGSVYKVEDHHAAHWFESKASHWAVVVAPWVLIQEVSNT